MYVRMFMRFIGVTNSENDYLVSHAFSSLMRWLAGREAEGYVAPLLRHTLNLGLFDVESEKPVWLDSNEDFSIALPTSSSSGRRVY